MKRNLTGLLLTLGFIVMFFGCSFLQEPVDRSVLEDAIRRAGELQGTVETGSAIGQASADETALLDSAISAAVAAKDNPDLTQGECDSAVNTLKAAVNRFACAVVPAFLYSRAGTVDVPCVINDYGSGTTLFVVTENDEYVPCYNLTWVENIWGNAEAGSVISFGSIDSFSLAEYNSFVFKLRTGDYEAFSLMINDDKSIDTQGPHGIDDYAVQLSDTWMWVRIPFSAIGSMPSSLTGLFIGFSGAGKARITDIGVSRIGALWD